MNNKIGALWIKRSQEGTTYFSGEIEFDGVKKRIVIFKNEKKSDKQPDYRILESQPMNQPTTKIAPDVEIDLDDIPFS